MATRAGVRIEPDREGWSEELFDALIAGGVRYFAYIPDAGNARLIALADRHSQATAVMLTTEEEGVAFCAGVDLVGGRSALVMQSSGVGNCGNFFSLIKGARFPVLMIITMRGDHGEKNPWQYPSGRAVRGFLEAMDIPHFTVSGRSDLSSGADAAISAAFYSGQGAALIISQRFLGAKAF